MKKCSNCKEYFSIDNFSFNKNEHDGRNSICKKCAIEYARNYRHSKIGVVTEIYSDQRKNSKRRGHPLPDYTKNQLTEWMFSKPEFHVLYDKWAENGHKKMEKPSCDRLDDLKPYTFDNLRIITWQENFDKGHKSCELGIISSGNKHTPILQIDLNGNIIKEYISQRSAARELNCSQANIFKALNSFTIVCESRWRYK